MCSAEINNAEIWHHTTRDIQWTRNAQFSLLSTKSQHITYRTTNLNVNVASKISTYISMCTAAAAPTATAPEQTYQYLSLFHCHAARQLLQFPVVGEGRSRQ